MSLIYKKRTCLVECLIDELRNLPRELRFAAVEELVRDADPETRSHSIEVAHALHHPETTDLCIALLADPDWRVRCTACESAYLANLAIPAGRLLQLVANDHHEYVRFYAALVLVKVASEGEVPELLRLAESVSGTNHEGTTVREVLLRAVAEIRTHKQN